MFLGMLDRGGVRVVSVQPGTSAIEITVKPGSLLGYHHSAQGKIAMAYGGAALFKKIVAAGLPALTPKTITGVITEHNQTFHSDKVILATGHSAEDMLHHLEEIGVHIEIAAG